MDTGSCQADRLSLRGQRGPRPRTPSSSGSHSSSHEPLDGGRVVNNTSGSDTAKDEDELFSFSNPGTRDEPHDVTHDMRVLVQFQRK